MSTKNCMHVKQKREETLVLALKAFSWSWSFV